MIPLMVIDMQSSFLDYCAPDYITPVIEQVVHQVRLAIRRKAPILIVEFRSSGCTIPAITTLVEPYKLVHTVIKSQMDVTSALPKKCQRLIQKASRLRVCGLYTEDCVCASVIGLLGKFRTLQIDLIKSACGANHPTVEEYEFMWVKSQGAPYQGRINLIEK